MEKDEFLENDNLQSNIKDLDKNEIEAPEGKYAAIGVDKDRTFIGILKLDEKGARRTSNVKELIATDRVKEYERSVATNIARGTEQEPQGPQESEAVATSIARRTEEQQKQQELEPQGPEEPGEPNEIER